MCLCYPVVLFFSDTDHITFVLGMSFVIFFFMTFTFGTVCRVFQISPREGEVPRVGEMKNFAEFFIGWRESEEE